MQERNVTRHNGKSTRRRATVGALLSLAILGLIVYGRYVEERAPQLEAAGDPVIMAAGDIACGSGSSGASCKQMQTSDLLMQQNPDAVLLTGDNQYEDGELPDYQSFYDPSWGRKKSITHPAIGNHEYGDPNGKGTFDYFNGVGNFSGPAGDRDKAYYSYDLGNWHLIALNSNCSKAGGCSAGSAQEQWLRADLAANTKPCTLAYWHHPRWTSDTRDFDTPAVQSFWNALYDYGAEVVLVGHSHFYERFAPQNPSHQLDNSLGIRQFIVGTGGRNVYGFGTIEANSQVRNGTTFGALKMTLHPGSYDWQFLPIAGSSFTDSGTTFCHGTTTDSSDPTTPTNLAATAVGGNRVDLTWTASTDNVAVAGYQVFRGGVEIGTSSTNSYSDTTAQPNATYSYQVKAFDTANNESGFSNTATVTTGDGPTILSFAPVDDAYVRSSQSGSNFGSASIVGVDGSPVEDLLLKFGVSGVGARQVVGATLRLYNTNESSVGGVFHRLANPAAAWQEETVTWANAPAADAAVLASLGAVAAGNWYEVDVTSLITGDGTFSLRANSASSNGADYSSKEGAAGQAPQLLVSVVDSNAPTPTPTRTPTATSTPTITPTPTPTITNTPLPSGQVQLNFAPIDDAHVRADSTAANAGGATSLEVDGSPIKDILMKFSVSGVGSGQIVTAKLRLYNVNEASAGGAFRRLANPAAAWEEETVTWANAPAADSAAFASLGAVAVGNWYEVDLAPLITGDGVFSLRITSTSSNGADYRSKEGSFPPQLELLVDTAP